MTRRRVVILGSTGSIGTQALDVIERNPDRFDVVALGAGGSNVDLLLQQAHRFGVDRIAVGAHSAAPQVVAAVGASSSIRWDVGAEAVADLAAVPCDVVLNAVAGAAGLAATLRALEAGSVVALANKESLIIGGSLVTRLAGPDQLVAVDSEHSALAQALRAGTAAEVRRLVLTASGGPFRGRQRSQLVEVTPEEALAHPTWSMGPLVTINSATLVNKGLEVIEAHLLFDVPMDRIDVVVHPQSVVHSMVEFVDGSTLAQASPPDMRLPIALGLDWPHRVAEAAPGCDWSAAATWDFEPVDAAAFPAVDIARSAGSQGGTAPAVFNAANEVCVTAFLERGLPFLAIVDTIEQVLGEHLSTTSGPARVLGSSEITAADDIWAVDRWARSRARDMIADRGNRHE